MRSVFIWRQMVTVKSAVWEAGDVMHPRKKQVDLMTGKDRYGCD